MIPAPQIEGTVPIQSSGAQFVEAFRRRVDAGLLLGRPHPRSDYEVAEAGAGQLRIRAYTWWTAINVGLNDVALGLSRPGLAYFRVRYWRWAAFALAVSGALGIFGVALLLTVDVRGYIASHATARFPGLSVERTLAILWAMVVFWGFIWPWLLIALHKRPLRRLIGRLIAEVDAEAHRPAAGAARTPLPNP
jgi:hypothetical protein